jgi:hypothetical protein
MGKRDIRSKPKHERERARKQAHAAVVEIAQALADPPDLGAPAVAPGDELQPLRDRAIRVLFRLLMTWKAETHAGRPALPAGVFFDCDADDVQRCEPLAHRIRARLGHIDLGDLGPVYEGLLDERLVAERIGGTIRLSLETGKGSRKTFGAYFTPDRLVDPLVRQAIEPLLDACGSNAERILGLRVIDPSMGAGAFLVKAVDVIARHLRIHCEPLDRDAPFDRGPGDHAYWKRKVAEHCIYGVDADPTAVELARAILCLHCADRGSVPGRLQDHLKCGDSLIGAPLDRLAAPVMRTEEPGNGSPGEARNGEHLAARKRLCDLWCAQWFLAGSTADWPRFFHWQLEFPEIALCRDGQLDPAGGFDVVLGNPPWNKIKPARRDFYSPFDAEVKNTQGPSLDALIARLEHDRPELRDLWIAYERKVAAYADFLAESGIYSHQMARVDGRMTGGDPDLFRYFVERSVEWLKPGGLLGLVVPCTLWSAEGCTALRRLLLDDCTIQSVYTFENYRKWAFGIHPSFKFALFTARREVAAKGGGFRAAFMLREPRVIEAQAHERLIVLSRRFVDAVSPRTKALLDVRTEVEARLVEKLHAAHPMIGDPASDWNVRYDRELDMTVDSWLFKRREWMQARGFTRVPGTAVPASDQFPPGGEYWVAASPECYRRQGYLERQGEIGARRLSWFVHPEDAHRAAGTRAPAAEHAFRIVPEAHYTALYEGRMVHLFDPSQKGYVAGEGRRAEWVDLLFDDKALRPRVFVCREEVAIDRPARVGFCDVTGATNERTLLTCLIPPGVACGNTVPVLRQEHPGDALLLLAVLGSFVADFLARLRVSTHLNWTYVASLAVPQKSSIPEHSRRAITQIAARLSCTLPELAGTWNAVFPEAPWTPASAERSLLRRAALRAELDAIVAELYGLTAAEYGYLLSTFPLLDRDQPALPGDMFVTEGDDRSRERGVEGQDWERRPWGIVEKRPRSFVTRDLALLTFMRRVHCAIPERLDEWYRDQVGLDPAGEISRFRIGEIKDLQARVARAEALGAVAYVPSSRRPDSGDPPEQD